MRREALSFVIPELEPGASHVVAQRVRKSFRVERLFASLTAEWPELRYLQRKLHVGGSRRKGRKASLLWSLATLAHAKKSRPIEMSLDSFLVVDYDKARDQLLGPLPLELFVPTNPDLYLNCDTSAPDQDITLMFTNQEICRRARGIVTLFGMSVPHQEKAAAPIPYDSRARAGSLPLDPQRGDLGDARNLLDAWQKITGGALEPKAGACPFCLRPECPRTCVIEKEDP